MIRAELATQEAKLERLEVAIATRLEIALQKQESMEAAMKRIEKTFDERMASQESRLMVTISDLLKRTE